MGSAAFPGLLDRGGFPKAGFGSSDRALPSVPRSPVQEYEQRLARLRADYEAEQESRARLEEDITAMRNSYDVKLSTLEQNLRKETGGPAPPGRREPSLLPPPPPPGPSSVSCSQPPSKADTSVTLPGQLRKLRPTEGEELP